MGWERPLLGVAMCTFMFGFAGLPPTGGFVGKFYAFSAAYRHGWTWLVIVGVVATAVSLYYYLAVVRAMYMRPATELQLTPTPVAAGGAPPRDLPLQATVLIAAAGTVAAFIAVEPLIHVAKQAAAALPF
jgi:NADH-quinone oxidoreductase subunit N